MSVGIHNAMCRLRWDVEHVANSNPSRLVAHRGARASAYDINYLLSLFVRVEWDLRAHSDTLHAHLKASRERGLDASINSATLAERQRDR